MLERLLINRPKTLKGDEPSAWRSDRPDTGGSTRRRKPDTQSTEAAAPARYVNIYSLRFLYVYILYTKHLVCYTGARRGGGGRIESRVTSR